MSLGFLGLGLSLFVLGFIGLRVWICCRYCLRACLFVCVAGCFGVYIPVRLSFVLLWFVVVFDLRVPLFLNMCLIVWAGLVGDTRARRR